MSRGDKKASIFLVIPCFREKGRVRDFLVPLCEEVRRRELSVQILLVDDGSGKEDAEYLKGLVREVSREYAFLQEPLVLLENVGKGGAIYAGWERAGEAEWVGFADADGAVSAGEVCRLVERVQEGEVEADAWIASRVKMLGRSVDRSLKRHIFGRIYATIASAFTGLEVYDSQCGFKVIRRESFLKIQKHLRDFRFGFDMELLAFLKEGGAKICEFPVDWWDVPGSKVRMMRDGSRMFFSLLALRQRLLAMRRKGGTEP